MIKFTYLGLSTDEKKIRLEKQIKGLNPPEKRGQEPFYHITKEDDEDTKEEKKKRTKKWLDERKKEIIAGIEAEDTKIAFTDPAFPDEMKPIIFEKGKAVSLPDDHPLVPKLKILSVGVEQPKMFKGHVIVKHEIFKMEVDKPSKAEEKFSKAEEKSAK